MVRVRPSRPMAVLNVAFVGSQETARSLAKLNDTRDLESYVHKVIDGDETKVLSLLRPLRHPERLPPLLAVLNVARCGVVEITKIDAALGEVLVAFGSAGIEQGHLIIAPEEGGWVNPEQVRVIQEQAGLGGWILHEQPPSEHQLRDSLYELLETLPSAVDEPLVIPVDQHFNVKGVGMVAIGYVQSGRVDKHQDLLTMPSSDSGVVRSLQVMDDDVDTAVAGDRVGVAFRNLREGALGKGTLLVHPDKDGTSFDDTLTRHDGSKITLQIAPFQNRSLEVGDVLHGSVDLQFVVGRIESISGDSIEIRWDTPLFIRNSGAATLILVQLDSSMRILGTAIDCEPL
jgi:selenocysteine-specific translation elongation factor